MRKLGILGLGNYTTTHYIGQLNRMFLNKMGGYSTCPFLLLNANFDHINPHLPNKLDRLEPTLLGYLEEITTLGIQYLLIPNITLHQTLDRLLKKHTFPFQILHPVELVANAIQKSGFQQATILATAYTMQSNYIPDILKKYNIQTIPPTPTQIIAADRIRKAIYNYGITPTVNQEWAELLEQSTPTEATVIACTELSLLSPKPTNTFDLVDLQIRAAIEII